MKNEKKITFHEILWYFIIFSIIGLIIETIYCLVTTGILESRKGLLWGPFCPVYGVGATVLILCLNRVDSRNSFELFIYGFLLGSLIEYLMSYVLEAIYSIRFWDYTYTGTSINGRICVPYSIFWGILAVFLIKIAKPLIDKWINKMSKKSMKIVDFLAVIFFIADVLVTIWAIKTYENRAIEKYYQIDNSKGIYDEQSFKHKVEENYFTTERMKKTFPNLRIKDEDGKEIWIKTLF